MPIRPEMRDRYPPYWLLLSRVIRFGRARQRCEHPDGCDAMSGQPHPVTGAKVVLTVAHWHDHAPEADRWDNLKALCQLHHLRHDAEHHRQTRRGRNALGDLFEVAP